ncbi:unnamed protein product [marine sediment metagenome]|uniref:Uncharacterized protein n=1 Tax=marine sediment metagenome TaxID=412755 RepID=X0TR01_9ZZZZ
MKQETREEHYHNYGFDRMIVQLFKWLILLIIVTNLLNMVTHDVMKDEKVHEKCLSACSQKHFMGTKIGLDNERDSCTVTEFDRTNCIDSCNKLYYQIRKDV